MRCGWGLLAVVLAVGCGDDDASAVPDAGPADGGIDAGVDAGPADLGPCPSAFRPTGCRIPPAEVPALPPNDGWHNLHADSVGSDEVGIALAPRFTEDWVAEDDTFNVTGPVFDAEGNLYFSPLQPLEDLALISLAAATGERRFAIEGNGALTGGGTPIVLRDPETGAERIYLGLYDRVIAVETDGTLVYEADTGLDPALRGDFAVFGLSYHPARDALVGLTQDGRVYMLARADGALLLDPPFALPGEVSPEGTLAIPAMLVDDVAAELAPFIQSDRDPAELLGVLLGNGTEVANFFSIDPNDGTLWIAATAPDAEDGTSDGVSELGALYAIEVAGEDEPSLVVRCRADFEGGSASTPALRQDGSRVYVGDNDGDLIALEPDCSEAWRYPIGDQIVGSIAVASDNGEVYAATATEIVALTDGGDEATLRFRVAPPGPERETGERTFNLNLVAITESGIAFQSGAGRLLGSFALPRAVGVGLLDRADGRLRWFTPGLDETVAVMSVGPDGGLYIGNSPLRRAIHRAIYGADESEPLRGGITRFAPDRRALARETACAGIVRAENAATIASSCPESFDADLTQLALLVEQGRAAIDGDPAALAAFDAARAAITEGDADAAARAFADARDALWP